MIDETEGMTRHRQVRVHYEDTVDHYADWFKEVQEDLDFYDGNQWEEADVQFLKKQNRPVLTWNLIQGKILHLLGAHSDNLHEPVIAPRGVEDSLRASILDTVRKQVYREVNMNDVDAEVFELGAKSGISGAALDIAPDPDDRSRVMLLCSPVHPIEVLWDPGSDRKDKSDASFLFWHRWLPIPTFKADYPEYADKVDEIMKQRDGETGVGYVESSGGFGEYYAPDTWAWSPRREMLYYDRRRKMIRVVRMEYRKTIRQYELLGPNNTRKVIPKSVVPMLKENYPQLTVDEYSREKFYWFEFTGHFTLFDDMSPLPFDGFSIIPYVCESDDANRPVGKVRALKDPQREVNKRYSQTLHMVNTQVAPGIFAEENSLVNEDQARASLKQAQSITHLKAGALAGGRIKERGIPQFPDSVGRLHEISVRMFDFISGISADDMVEPRGIPEAAATTQLKHRKSMMSTKPLLSRFWVFQRTKAERVMECIVKVFPDAQIEEYLANSKLYRVQNGQILVGQGEQQQSVDIRDLRGHKMNVELRPAATNETERLLELQVLMALLQFQIPVSPEVLFDMLGLPDEKKDRLKQFAAQMAQSRSQAEEKQIQLTEGQLQSQAILDLMKRGIETEKTLETHRHNMATEYLQGMKQGMETRSRMEELWERASDNQRNAIIELIAAKARERGAAARPQVGAGSQQGG